MPSQSPADKYKKRNQPDKKDKTKFRIPAT